MDLNWVKRNDELGGRTQPGANFHCSHSTGEFFNKIVDWKPLDYFTVLQTGVAGLVYYRTIHLAFDGKVTKFGVCFSTPEKPVPEGVCEFLEPMLRGIYGRFGPAMQADYENGKFSVQQ